MDKIRIKDLIEFRNKKDGPRKTFVNNLKKEKQKKQDGDGGDYWITSLSAISNTFRHNNTDFLQEKIDDLQEKIVVANHKNTKDQYKRNIDILIGFKEYDLDQIRPDADLKFHKKPNDKSLINIKGIPVQAWPHHVFSFSINDSDEIGAVWFVTKLTGFKTSELGMFADILFRYLDTHYSKDFYVNPDYCIAVNASNGQEVNYQDILNGDVPVLIDSTIDELMAM